MLVNINKTFFYQFFLLLSRKKLIKNILTDSSIQCYLTIMSRTSQHLLNPPGTDWNQLSISARSDYDFNRNLNAFCKQHPPPSNEQLNSLSLRYQMLINEGTTADDLHNAYINKTLISLLGEGFEWVRTMFDLIS